MLRQIGQKPPSDFADPLGMLEDCHRRILFFLKTLAQVAAGPEGGALTGVRRDALETTLRYFREAAPKHNADEERSLFPRLRRTNHPRARAIVDTLDVLEREHASADLEHAEIDAIGRRWLSNGTIPDIDLATLGALVDRLSAFYERHIAVEESEIFTVAKQVLSEPEKQRLGREMAQRRGLDSDTFERIPPHSVT